MRLFATVVSAVLALTAFDPVSAAPALDQVFLQPSSADDVGARSCQIVYPSFIKPIFSWAPDNKAPNTMLADRLFQVQSSSLGWQQDSLVMFTGIPSNAYGCQLQYLFPNGYPVTTYGHTQFYVYKTDRNATDDDTWRNSPKKKFQWGTANPASGASGVVNTETCWERLTYRIEIGHEDKLNTGQVSWYQANGFTFPTAGWVLTHSC